MCTHKRDTKIIYPYISRYLKHQPHSPSISWKLCTSLSVSRWVADLHWANPLTPWSNRSTVHHDLDSKHHQSSASVSDSFSIQLVMKMMIDGVLLIRWFQYTVQSINLIFIEGEQLVYRETGIHGRTWNQRSTRTSS